MLAPSARYHRQRGRRHKKLTDWARQMILSASGGRRWLPERPLALVGDGGYAVLDLLTAANRWPNPLPSSPVCAWTPPSMNRRHHVNRAGTVSPR